MAKKYADAEDLKGIYPSIDQVDQIDIEMLESYVDEHWEEILPCIDVEDIMEWFNDVGYDEGYEEPNSLEEEDSDRIQGNLKMAEVFRSLDYAGLKGYPAKRIGS